MNAGLGYGRCGIVTSPLPSGSSEMHEETTDHVSALGMAFAWPFELCTM